MGGLGWSIGLAGPMSQNGSRIPCNLPSHAALQLYLLIRTDYMFLLPPSSITQTGTQEKWSLCLLITHLFVTCWSIGQDSRGCGPCWQLLTHQLTRLSHYPDKLANYYAPTLHGFCTGRDGSPAESNSQTTPIVALRILLDTEPLMVTRLPRRGVRPL